LVAATALKLRLGPRLRYSRTARVALLVEPLYEAEIVEDVVMRTIDVFTVKDARAAPAGTVTREGTEAAPLLLESVTIAPPEGAGPLRVTVPVEDCTPPTTLDGLRLTDETDGSGGITLREADLLTPL
jgi:hypothetical protein